jgi:hypothetical protein
MKSTCLIITKLLMWYLLLLVWNKFMDTKTNQNVTKQYSIINIQIANDVQISPRTTNIFSRAISGPWTMVGDRWSKKHWKWLGRRNASSCEFIKKNFIFWGISLCGPLKIQSTFGESYCLHLQGLKSKPGKKPAWSRQQVELCYMSFCPRRESSS